MRASGSSGSSSPPPSKEYFDVSDTEAHNMNEVADRDATISQHTALQEKLASRGAEVIDAPELDGHPNSVFTRDVSLMTPQGYIKLRMGIDTRRGEEAWLGAVLEEHGEACAGEIEAPRTVEGGDVTIHGDVAFVGPFGPNERKRRAADFGASSENGLRSACHGRRRLSAPRRCGERRSAGSFARRARRLPAWFLQRVRRDRSEQERPVDGECHLLAPNEVVANEAENQEAMDVLDSRGVQVHGVDLSEFRKGARGPTCLIMPVEREA